MFSRLFRFSGYRRLGRRQRRLLLGHLERLSEEDLYHRFLNHMNSEDLRSHVARPSPEHETIGWFHRGVLRGAIEVFYHDARAEAAVTLEREWRRQGIGTELVRRGIARARRRQVVSFDMLSYRGNIAMLRIAEKFSASESYAHGRPIEGLAPDAPLPAWLTIDLREPAAASSRRGVLRTLLARLTG